MTLLKLKKIEDYINTVYGKRGYRLQIIRNGSAVTFRVYPDDVGLIPSDIICVLCNMIGTTGHVFTNTVTPRFEISTTLYK